MSWFLKKQKNIQIFAPVDGFVKNIEEVEDEVFAKKLLGDGLAIIPSKPDFVAPFSGIMKTVFPTKHAYGIKHKSGVEILIHVGLESVKLKGKGLESFVTQGQKVKQGDLLAKLDLDFLKKEIAKKDTDTIISLDTPLIFTQDSMQNHSLKIIKTGQVKQNDLIAEIKL